MTSSEAAAAAAPPTDRSRRTGARFQFGATTAFLVIGNLINLGTAILLARWIGEDAFGRVMYAFAASAFLSMIAKAGLDQALVYFYPRYQGAPERRRGLFWTALGGATLATAATSVLVWAARGPLDGTITITGFAEDAVWIASMSVALSVINVVGAGLNAARHADLRAAVVYVLFPGLFLAWALVEPHPSVGNLLAGRLLALVVATAACFVLLRRYTGTECLGAGPRDTSDRREWWRYAAPSVLSGIVLYLLEHVDVLMLGGLSDAGEVGYYAVAARCIMPLVLLRLAFSMVLEPRVAHHHHAGTLDGRQADVRRASRWFARAVALFVGVAIAARDIVPVVFGAQYEASIPILIWLAIGYGLAAWLGIGATILNMTGAPRLELINGLVTLGLNVLLCAIFIGRWGAEGAAIATTISLAVMGALRIVQVRLHVGWNPISAGQLVPFAMAGLALLAVDLASLSRVQAGVVGACLVPVAVALETAATERKR